MALNCDLDALLLDSACFLNGCLSDDELRAIEIYLKVESLSALGGADYSSDLTSLLEAAKAWQVITANSRQLNAINTSITRQNAIDNGVTADTDVDSLKAAAACYLCLPPTTKQQLLLFLKCAINSEGAPD